MEAFPLVRDMFGQFVPDVVGPKKRTAPDCTSTGMILMTVLEEGVRFD